MVKRLSTVLLLALAIALLPQSAWAQHRKVEITPNVGFKWGNSLNITTDELNEDVKLKSGVSWGATVDFNINPNVAIEVLYNTQKSDVEVRGRMAGAPHIIGQGRASYIEGGGLFTFNPHNRKVNWFLLATAGAAIFSSDIPESVEPGATNASTTKFTFGFGGGAKIWLSDAVGLRLQARGYSTRTNLGQLGWWCGYYTCGTIVTNQYFWQGEISAGLTFAVGE